MVVVTIASLLLILLVFVDAFEALVLPRRVKRRLRPARFFYRGTWNVWSTLAWYIPPGSRRESYLSFYGPLSLLALLAMWALALIAGFSLLHWSLATPINTLNGQVNFLTYLYLSGVTFFTLGFGEVTPATTLGRFITVSEAGIGFGFLAVVIGYLPVVYQAFSRREVEISLLDARAGSPPTAAQFLLRLARTGNLATMDRFLQGWERWAADLLESHISFPPLCYYRSQHDNQSWLAAMTAMLDTCALSIAAVEIPTHQLELTFAMARHALVDMAMVFGTPPKELERDRLPSALLARLLQEFREAGLPLREGEVEEKLKDLRAVYEPFLAGLAGHFLFSVPPIAPEGTTVDNWQSSAWTRHVKSIDQLAPQRRSFEEDDHLF